MTPPEAMWAWLPEAAAFLGGFVFSTLAVAWCFAIGLRWVREGAKG